MASIPRFETIPTTETVKTSEHEDEHAEMTVGQKLKDFTHTITGEKLEGISETVKEAAIEIEEDAKRLGRLKDKDPAVARMIDMQHKVEELKHVLDAKVAEEEKALAGVKMVQRKPSAESETGEVEENIKGAVDHAKRIVDGKDKEINESIKKAKQSGNEIDEKGKSVGDIVMETAHQVKQVVDTKIKEIDHLVHHDQRNANNIKSL